MEGEFQDQGQLDQDLEEWLSPRGSQYVHGFFSEEETCSKYAVSAKFNDIPREVKPAIPIKSCKDQ